MAKKVIVTGGGNVSIGRVKYITNGNLKAESVKERKLFSNDNNELTNKLAKNYLKGKENPTSHRELIISFEKNDYQRLGATNEECKAALRETIREGLNNLWKELEVKDVRWVAGIHLNTNNPHAHIVYMSDAVSSVNGEPALIPQIPRSWFWRERADNSRLANFFEPALAKRIKATPPDKLLTTFLSDETKLPAKDYNETRTRNALQNLSDSLGIAPATVEHLTTEQSLYVNTQGVLTFVRRTINGEATGFHYLLDNHADDEKGFFFIGNPQKASRFIIADNPAEVLSAWELTAHRDLSDVVFLAADKNRQIPPALIEIIKEVSNKKSIRLINAFGCDAKTHQQATHSFHDLQKTLSENRPAELPAIEFFAWQPKAGFGQNWSDQLSFRNLPGELQTITKKLSETASIKRSTEEVNPDYDIRYAERVKRLSGILEIETRGENEFAVTSLNLTGERFELGRFRQSEDFEETDNLFSLTSIAGEETSAEAEQETFADELEVLERIEFLYMQKLENQIRAERTEKNRGAENEKVAKNEAVNQISAKNIGNELNAEKNERALSPQEITARLKEIPLEDVLTRFGLQLTYDQDRREHIYRDAGKLHKIKVKGDLFCDRYDDNRGGRNAVNLVMHLTGNSFSEARRFLLDNFGTQYIPQPQKRQKPEISRNPTDQNKIKPPFVMPELNVNKLPIVRDYLINTRGLDETLIDTLIEQGNIAANNYGGAVFFNRDTEVVVKGASWRATAGTKRGDYPGTDKTSAWFTLGAELKKATRFVIVESPIEALSYYQLHRDSTEWDKTVVISTATNSVSASLIEVIENTAGAKSEMVIAYNNDARGELGILQTLEKIGQFCLLKHKTHFENDLIETTPFSGKFLIEVPTASDWNEQVAAVNEEMRSLADQEHIVAEIEVESTPEFPSVSENDLTIANIVLRPLDPDQNSIDRQTFESVTEFDRFLESLDLNDTSRLFHLEIELNDGSGYTRDLLLNNKTDTLAKIIEREKEITGIEFENSEAFNRAEARQNLNFLKLLEKTVAETVRSEENEILYAEEPELSEFEKGYYEPEFIRSVRIGMPTVFNEFGKAEILLARDNPASNTFHIGYRLEFAGKIIKSLPHREQPAFRQGRQSLSIGYDLLRQKLTDIWIEQKMPRFTLAETVVERTEEKFLALLLHKTEIASRSFDVSFEKTFSIKPDLLKNEIDVLRLWRSRTEDGSFYKIEDVFPGRAIDANPLRNVMYKLASEGLLETKKEGTFTLIKGFQPLTAQALHFGGRETFAEIIKTAAELRRDDLKLQLDNTLEQLKDENLSDDEREILGEQYEKLSDQLAATLDSTVTDVNDSSVTDVKPETVPNEAEQKQLSEAQNLEITLGNDAHSDYRLLKEHPLKGHYDLKAHQIHQIFQTAYQNSVNDMIGFRFETNGREMEIIAADSAHGVLETAFHLQTGKLGKPHEYTLNQMIGEDILSEENFVRLVEFAKFRHSLATALENENLHVRATLKLETENLLPNTSAVRIAFDEEEQISDFLLFRHFEKDGFLLTRFNPKSDEAEEETFDQEFSHDYSSVLSAVKAIFQEVRMAQNRKVEEIIETRLTETTAGQIKGAEKNTNLTDVALETEETTGQTQETVETEETVSTTNPEVLYPRQKLERAINALFTENQYDFSVSVHESADEKDAFDISLDETRFPHYRVWEPTEYFDEWVVLKNTSAAPRPSSNGQATPSENYNFETNDLSFTSFEAVVRETFEKIVRDRSLRSTKLTVLQSPEQTGRIEKRVAKLLHAHGLADEIAAAEEGFYAVIKNDPFMDLHITKDYDSNLIRLTHYYEQNGDLMHDGEMNFHLSKDGHLSLHQVASALYGVPHYGFDRSFANMFSNNLIEQGFEHGTLERPNQIFAEEETFDAPQNEIVSEILGDKQPEENAEILIETNLELKLTENPKDDFQTILSNPVTFPSTEQVMRFRREFDKFYSKNLEFAVGLEFGENAMEIERIEDFEKTKRVIILNNNERTSQYYTLSQLIDSRNITGQEFAELIETIKARVNNQPTQKQNISTATVSKDEFNSIEREQMFKAQMGETLFADSRYRKVLELFQHTSASEQNLAVFQQLLKHPDANVWLALAKNQNLIEFDSLAAADEAKIPVTLTQKGTHLAEFNKTGRIPADFIPNEEITQLFELQKRVQTAADTFFNDLGIKNPWQVVADTETSRLEIGFPTLTDNLTGYSYIGYPEYAIGQRENGIWQIGYGELEPQTRYEPENFDFSEPENLRFWAFDEMLEYFTKRELLPKTDLSTNRLSEEKTKLFLQTEPPNVKRGTISLAEEVRDALHAGNSIKNNTIFNKMAERNFGGSRAQGTFDARDAFDALELGVNLYLLDIGKNLTQNPPEVSLKELRDLLRRLPTQTDRTDEQNLFQQFSTPPTLSFVAYQALGLQSKDILLEPSAGNAGLALWARVAGIKAHVNEISDRRAGILKIIGFDSISRKDAQFLNDTLDPQIKPSVILMNPPFSATGGRTRNRTIYGAEHISDALLRLEEGGRLVAVVGEGMGFDKSSFTTWWAGIMQKYNVRANLGMPGEEYGKYGTTFGNQLLIIDKNGKTPGKTLDEQFKNVRQGSFNSLEEILQITTAIGSERAFSNQTEEVLKNDLADNLSDEARQNLIDLYVEAMDTRNDEMIARVLQQATTDSELDERISQINAAYADEQNAEQITIDEKIRLLEKARSEGIGAITLGKIERLEERGYRVIFGTPEPKSELHNKIAGILGPAADRFLEKGLTIEKISFQNFQTREWITRTEVLSESDKIFLYGDNLKETGFGGQAKEMRGTKNSIGIPTKKEPAMEDYSFFSDTDFDANRTAIDKAFAKLALFPKETTIVLPSAGIGTGLAKLEEKAPLTFLYLQKKIESLGFTANTEKYRLDQYDLENFPLALEQTKAAQTLDDIYSSLSSDDLSETTREEMEIYAEELNTLFAENNSVAKAKAVFERDQTTGDLQSARIEFFGVADNPLGVSITLEADGLNYRDGANVTKIGELPEVLEELKNLNTDLDSQRIDTEDIFRSIEMREALITEVDAFIKKQLQKDVYLESFYGQESQARRIDIFGKDAGNTYKIGEIHNGTDLFTVTIGDETSEIYSVVDLTNKFAELLENKTFSTATEEFYKNLEFHNNFQALAEGRKNAPLQPEVNLAAYFTAMYENNDYYDEEDNYSPAEVRDNYFEETIASADRFLALSSAVQYLPTTVKARKELEKNERQLEIEKGNLGSHVYAIKQYFGSENEIFIKNALAEKNLRFTENYEPVIFNVNNNHQGANTYESTNQRSTSLGTNNRSDFGNGGVQPDLFSTSNQTDELSNQSNNGRTDLSDDAVQSVKGNSASDGNKSDTAVAQTDSANGTNINHGRKNGVSANADQRTQSGNNGLNPSETEVLNDLVINELKTGQKRYLMLPETLDLTEKQLEVFLANQDNLTLIGFDTIKLSNKTIGIKSSPGAFKSVNHVFGEILDNPPIIEYLRDKNAPVKPLAEILAPKAVEFIEIIKREKVITLSELKGLGVVSYQPAKLATGNAHPADIVESASMAAVTPPEITYTPKLPKEIIEEGKLSSLQLETIVYAGQRHERLLSDGARAAFFIGDGTGVGKGRELAGIALDNWNQDRRRILWLSINFDLVPSADRDLKDLGAYIPLSSLDKHSVKTNLSEAVGDGILFSSYATLIGQGKDGKTRLDQIVKWLGEDGVIMFDEGHLAKNAVAFGRSTASQRGEVVLQLQQGEKSNPNWRIVYSSATGATELRNMAYMERLGLWGDGTGFPGGFAEFHNTIDKGGIGAMEMVARDMKAAGMYMSRSISFRGVDYRQVHHELTPHQKEIYNLSSKAWSMVVRNFDDALRQTNANNKARAMAFARLWSGQQLFYRQLMTALKVPAVIKETERLLETGSVVTDENGNQTNTPAQVIIGVIGTGEARTKEQVSKAVQLGLDLDSLDFSPKQILLNVVNSAFPTKRYTEQIDPASGNTIKVPVVDEDGNHLESREAQLLRDQLLVELEEKVTLPDNPLDQIVNYFGENSVAEITGRKKRIIVDQETGERHYVKRARDGVAMDKASQDEMNAFQAGRKKIAIISQSASTGISLHSEWKPLIEQYVADNKLSREAADEALRYWKMGNTAAANGVLIANNLSAFRRVHITLETSWSADVQMQTFGRSHRSNQFLPPEYVLMSTDLGGEKRFLSTIAKRLGSLGALTKGDREQAGGGDLLQYDFENKYGAEAARSIVFDLRDESHTLMSLLPPDIETGEEQRGMAMLYKMGLAKYGDGGALVIKDKTIEDLEVSRFLNRVLMLDVDTQNAVFNAFTAKMENFINKDKELGLFDEGVRDIEGDNIRFAQAAKIVATDHATGAHTLYYQINADTPTHPVSLDDINERNRVIKLNGVEIGGNKEKGVFYQQTHSKNIIYVEFLASRTDEKTGFNQRYYKFARPQGWQSHLLSERELLEKYRPVRIEDNLQFKDDVQMKAADWWTQKFAETPKTHVETHHIIAGAVLPVWQRLSASNAEGNQLSLKTVRLETIEGERVVGVKIPAGHINRVLRDLGVERSFRTAPEIFEAIVDTKDTIDLVGGIKLRPAFLKKQPAIQIMNLSPYQKSEFVNFGALKEIIAFDDRYFIPTDAEKGIEVLGKILNRYPAASSEAERLAELEATQKKAAETGGLAKSFYTNTEFFELAESYRNIPVANYFWQLRAEQNEKGQVLLNPASYQFLLSVYKESFNKRIENFEGLFNDTPTTERFFESLDRRAQSKTVEAEAVASLTKVLAEARASRTDNLLILLTNENAGAHEELHVSSYIASAGKTLEERHNRFDELRKSEAYAIAKPFLKELEKTDNDGILIEECFAYCASGEADKLNLLPEEAADFVELWFKSFAEKNGIMTKDQFKELTDESRQIRNNAYKIIAVEQTQAKLAAHSETSGSPRRTLGSVSNEQSAGGNNPPKYKEATEVNTLYKSNTNTINTGNAIAEIEPKDEIFEKFSTLFKKQNLSVWLENSADTTDSFFNFDVIGAKGTFYQLEKFSETEILFSEMGAYRENSDLFAHRRSFFFKKDDEGNYRFDGFSIRDDQKPLVRTENILKDKEIARQEFNNLLAGLNNSQLYMVDYDGVYDKTRLNHLEAINRENLANHELRQKNNSTKRNDELSAGTLQKASDFNSTADLPTGDEPFENLVNLIERQNLDILLQNGKPASFELQTLRRQPLRYRLEINAEKAITFTAFNPANRNLYRSFTFTKDTTDTDDGFYRFSHIREKRSVNSDAELRTVGIKEQPDLQIDQIHSDLRREQLFISDLKTDDENFSKNIEAVNQINITRKIAENKGLLISADIRLKENDFDIREMREDYATEVYNLEIKRESGEIITKQTSLKQLELERKIYVADALQTEAANGFLKNLAQEKGFTVQDAEKERLAFHNLECEKAQKPFIEEINDSHQKNLRVLKNREKDLQQARETVSNDLAAIEKIYGSTKDITPKIQPETIWGMQHRAAERGDAETFDRLEEIHQANNIPRPNRVYERLLGLKLVTEERAKSAANQLLQDISANRPENLPNAPKMIAEIKKDAENGKIEIENIRFENQTEKEAEYAKQSELAKQEAERERQNARQAAWSPIRHFVDPFSPINGKLAWFTKPLQTLNAHVNPVEIVRNNPAMQVVRAVSGYLEHSGKAAELERTAQEFAKKAAALQEINTLEKQKGLTQLKNISNSVATAVKNEETLRTRLLGEGETNAELLQTPPPRMKKDELLELRRNAVRNGSTEITEELRDIGTDDLERASAEYGFSKEKIAAFGLQDQTDAALQARSAINQITETGLNEFEVEFDAVKLQKAVELERTAQITANWSQNLNDEIGTPNQIEMSLGETAKFEQAAQELGINKEVSEFIADQQAATIENMNEAIRQTALAQQKQMTEAAQMPTQTAQINSISNLQNQLGSLNNPLTGQTTGQNLNGQTQFTDPEKRVEVADSEYWKNLREHNDQLWDAKRIAEFEKLSADERAARIEAEIEAAEALEAEESIGAMRFAL